MSEPIPVIDIFAGPGGLGEGFTSVYDENNKRVFKIALSIEKDEFAHQTLELRSFYRQFDKDKVPDDYYKFLRGEISKDDLYNNYPKESADAKKEAWKATLGETPNKQIDAKIKKALKGKKKWVLIGGPPCQAYSIAGRSRLQRTSLDPKEDDRVELYKQYLRILAIHNPSVFLMENVKGLLSAQVNNNLLFKKILKDLSNPGKAFKTDKMGKLANVKFPQYNIYSLVKKPLKYDNNNSISFEPQDYLIKSEDYGIPQTRHRVILLGIRKDISYQPKLLTKTNKVSIARVINKLPKIRSRISKHGDNNTNWKNAIKDLFKEHDLNNVDRRLKAVLKINLKKITIPKAGTGGEFIKNNKIDIGYNKKWYLDKRIKGVCNHSSKSHMPSDLQRYFFASCYVKRFKKSPKLEDFPKSLLPDHDNIVEGITDRKFADRFRVQVFNRPCKTITSHISKDGHYYIHPDAQQCRSLTVREAARIQTFPDNYFFCGPRTSQYTQVGNAVPPLLANKLALIVKVFFTINK